MNAVEPIHLQTWGKNFLHPPTHTLFLYNINIMLH